MQEATNKNAHGQHACEPDTEAMLERALWYASQGFHVIPLYEPVFDEQDELIGCTCNRGAGCKSKGKHPRGKWRKESTTDPDQIREWWGRWPTANIGVDCGKSGLLVLDRDSYKDNYAGDALDIDEETVTVLTGGGGTHLWYRMPAGKSYGNGERTLPDGIDVRGDGGYVVAPPSLHESGRRYEFELEYGPAEIEIKELSPDLQELLDAAQSSVPLPEVQIGEVPSTAPDLSQWCLSHHILDLIHRPLPKGERSEADMTVCVALCFAGASDEEIYGVFARYPIGTAGKFRERGDDYLVRTIAKARQYVGGHTSPDPAELRALRQWVKSISFKDFVPKELQCKVGYRTDSTDTKLADALLDVAEKRNAWTFRVGLKELRDKAGLGSPSTVKKGLERLGGWFVEVVEPGSGTQSTQYRIVVREVVFRSYPITELYPVIGYDLTTTYSRHKADDPFLLGRSRTAKRENLDEPSLKEPLLRVIYALERHQKTLTEDQLEEPEHYASLTRRELSEATGKSIHSIRTATRKGEEYRILLDCQEKKGMPKKYMLSPWAWDIIRRWAPKMKTYKLSLERKDRDLEHIQRRHEDALRLGADGAFRLGREERLYRERQREWAIAERTKLVARIFPDWTEEQVMRWIESEVPIRQRYRAIETVKHARQGLAEGEQGQWHDKDIESTLEDLYNEAADQLIRLDIPKKDWRRLLPRFGYAPTEVTEILSIAAKKIDHLFPQIERQESYLSSGNTGLDFA